MLDFSHVDSRPRTQQTTKASGEFEVPVMNEVHHETPKAKKSKGIGELSFYTNIISCIGNFLGFICTVIPFLKPYKPIAEKLANWGTNSFLITNASVNIYNRAKDHNYLSAAGYLNDLYVGLFVPHRDKYLSRGPSVGFSQFANVINNLNKKFKFSGPKEHWDYIKLGTQKAWNNIINIRQAIKQEDNGIFGLIGAALSLLGTLVWKITGSEKLGALIRDGGGGSLDVEQVIPYQWAAKRYRYVSSGISYIIGTTLDVLSKFSPKLEPTLRYLCFIADCIGKDLQRQSEDLGEMSFTPEATKGKLKEIRIPNQNEPKISIKPAAQTRRDMALSLNSAQVA